MSPPAVVHDLPTDDVVAHDPTERCPCGTQRVPAGGLDEHGHRTFLIVHPRLDAPGPVRGR